MSLILVTACVLLPWLSEDSSSRRPELLIRGRPLNELRAVHAEAPLVVPREAPRIAGARLVESAPSSKDSEELRGRLSSLYEGDRVRCLPTSALKVNRRAHTRGDKPLTEEDSPRSTVLLTAAALLFAGAILLPRWKRRLG